MTQEEMESALNLMAERAHHLWDRLKALENKVEVLERPRLVDFKMGEPPKTTFMTRWDAAGEPGQVPPHWVTDK